MTGFALITRGPVTHTVDIPLPDSTGREELFRINLKSVEVAPEVDFSALAAKCEGYSGADVTNVCRDASLMAMRRAIQGKTPDEIRALSKEQLETPITQQDMEVALTKVQSSVGKEQLLRYEEWSKEFGSV